MDRLAELFRCLQLSGTCRTTFGETLTIDEELGDLAALWELASGSRHLVDDDQAEKIAGELHKIRRAIEKLQPKPDAAEQRRRVAASKLRRPTRNTWRARSARQKRRWWRGCRLEMTSTPAASKARPRRVTGWRTTLWTAAPKRARPWLAKSVVPRADCDLTRPLTASACWWRWGARQLGSAALTSVGRVLKRVSTKRSSANWVLLLQRVVRCGGYTVSRGRTLMVHAIDQRDGPSLRIASA